MESHSVPFRETIERKRLPAEPCSTRIGERRGGDAESPDAELFREEPDLKIAGREHAVKRRRNCARWASSAAIASSMSRKRITGDTGPNVSVFTTFISGRTWSSTVGEYIAPLLVSQPRGD